MEWEQIYSQQENGKWNYLLEVLQKVLPSKNHNLRGPARTADKWAQSSCEPNRAKGGADKEPSTEEGKIGGDPIPAIYCEALVHLSTQPDYSEVASSMPTFPSFN